jgi:hypothetical protein
MLSITYTPEEVFSRLRQDPSSDGRTAEVLAAASDVSAWTSRLDPQTADELGRTADRLPSAVFWYVQGRPRDEIGRRLRPLGGIWDADLALEVASFLIASVLNERGARTAQGVSSSSLT